MPVPYSAGSPSWSLWLRIRGTALQKVFQHAYIWIWIGLFVVFGVTVELWAKYTLSRSLPNYLSEIEEALRYPASIISMMYTFQLGFFTNKCYSRYKEYWQAAMLGWSRLNDLGLQVRAYVKDDRVACDVMRLMHAANHLCYGDFASQNMMDVAIRRRLLTHREALLLRRPGGPAPFYQCSVWALELLADPDAKVPVREQLLLALDRSICQWREATTLVSSPPPPPPPGRPRSRPVTNES